MRREDLGDLVAFVMVAEELSFTRAAARLGTSQSSLSLIIRRLEQRLGLRLLTRTTRSISPTTAGEQLLATLVPSLGNIDAQIAALTEFRETPSGSFRITASEHAFQSVLWPKLSGFLKEHPDIKVEVISDWALTDIVADRFDAGVRLGDQIEKDMIGVRIAPSARMVVACAPDYLEGRVPPILPQDLTSHVCINMRMPTYGGFYIWEFAKDEQELRVRVDGQLAFNGVAHVLAAALDGFGMAYLHEDVVLPCLADGRLVQVLGDWCPRFPGYQLYYPSRRHPSPAFSMMVDALRHRSASEDAVTYR